MIEPIIDRLFVGDNEGYQKLQHKSGWSHLRCCKEGPGGHRDELHYDGRSAPKGKNYYFVQKKNLMALNLIDAEDPAYIPEEVINTGLKFLKDQLENTDNKILVSCNQGHSRSPSIMMMFLRVLGELPAGYHNAVKIFKTLCPSYNPNPGMLHYVKSHYSRLGPKEKD